MENEERIRILETEHAGAPGTEELADWLERQANHPDSPMPYLDPRWELLRVSSPTGTREPDPRWQVGDEKSFPALLPLDDTARRSFMLATRTARELTHEWRRLRDEALLALIRDGDTDRMLAGIWTASRIRLAADVQGVGGKDPSSTHAWNILWALNALGTGDDALATEYIPAGVPLAKGAYRPNNVEANAFSAVVHGEHVDEAAAGARKVASGKSTPAFERLLMGYLAAVVEHDEPASLDLAGKVLSGWAKSPYNRAWADRSVHAVPLHIYGYLELGNQRFGWDPLRFAEADVLCEDVLRAAQYARELTAQERANVHKPTVAFHGRCIGLNDIFRERPITAAAASVSRGATSARRPSTAPNP